MVHEMVNDRFLINLLRTVLIGATLHTPTHIHTHKNMHTYT